MTPLAGLCRWPEYWELNDLRAAFVCFMLRLDNKIKAERDFAVHAFAI